MRGVLHLKNKSYFILFILLFTVLLTACTSTHDSEQFQQLLEKALEEPESIEDITHYPKGLLASMTYEENMDGIMDEIKSIMPPIKEEKDEAFLDD